MMRILFIAPPAAGKGTQAEYICKEFQLAHVSIGDIIRSIIEENSPLGKSIRETVQKGELLEDALMVQLIKNRLASPDCLNGYVLDGFPRTLSQAKLLDQLEPPTHAFYMHLPEEEVKKRIVGRLTCPICKRVYNEQISSLQSMEKGICDDCNVPLERREDDTEESFHRRYQIYLKETLPLKEYYEQRGILIPIDSNTGKMEVFEQIKEVLHDFH